MGGRKGAWEGSRDTGEAARREQQRRCGRGAQWGGARWEGRGGRDGGGWRRILTHREALSVGAPRDRRDDVHVGLRLEQLPAVRIPDLGGVGSG